MNETEPLSGLKVLHSESRLAQLQSHMTKNWRIKFLSDRKSFLVLLSTNILHRLQSNETRVPLYIYSKLKHSWRPQDQVPSFAYRTQHLSRAHCRWSAGPTRTTGIWAIFRKQASKQHHLHHHILFTKPFWPWLQSEGSLFVESSWSSPLPLLCCHFDDRSCEDIVRFIMDQPQQPRLSSLNGS